MDAHIKEMERSHGLEAAALTGHKLLQGEEERGTRDTRNKPYNAQPATPEASLDRQALEKYLGEVKNRLASNGVELKFKFHEDSGDLQVELVNADNDKVVRKIPPDELLKLSSSLREMAGTFLDRSV